MLGFVIEIFDSYFKSFISFLLWIFILFISESKLVTYLLVKLLFLELLPNKQKLFNLSYLSEYIY